MPRLLTTDDLNEKIKSCEAAIAKTEKKLEDLKKEKADWEDKLNKKQQEEQKEQLLSAVQASGKSIDEIMAFLNQH